MIRYHHSIGNSSARLSTTCFSFFFFNDTATTEIYTLSLHDALPISFWSVVKKGAQQAAKDEGVKLIWSPSNNDPQKEAQLIDAAVSQKVDGLAVSVPNADAIKGSLAKAKAAGIPIITLNSGVDDYKALGAIT